jgi:hypothetical protein
MSGSTLSVQQRMRSRIGERPMNSTNERTTEGERGSQAMKLIGTPAMPQLKPWDLAEIPLFRFRNGKVVDVEHATPEQFEAWRKQNGIPAKGGVKWNFEMRCKTLNYCRFYGVWDALKFPIDFSAETAPNTAPTDAPIGAERRAEISDSDVPNCAEDTGFLRDVERAKPVLHANPEISAKELADALGLQSAVYAQTLKVYVSIHAQNAQMEGA